MEAIGAVKQKAKSLRKKLKIQELSSAQTLSIYESNLADKLFPEIELIQGCGPGYWSIPPKIVDCALELASQPNTILATFPELASLAGSVSSLQSANLGDSLKLVASPQEAVALATDNPEKTIVFFVAGREEIIPAVAETILKVEAEEINNFAVYSNLTMTLPALKSLLDSPGEQIDGFICSAQQVFNLEALNQMSARYKKPIVITDESLENIVSAIDYLLNSIQSQNNNVSLCGVTFPKINLENCQKVFQVRHYYEWRGLGSIDRSALSLNQAYKRFDAEARFELKTLKIADCTPCQCSEVIRGVMQPNVCKVFGNICQPSSPKGIFMVSEEGICQQYYARLMNN